MQISSGNLCTHNAIQTDVPHQIWEAITSMGNSDLPIWLIRILHNKVRYFGVNYSQCYFYYLSPKYLYVVLGPLLFVLLFLGLWLILKTKSKWKHIVWLIISLYPMIMIFEMYRI